MTEKFESSQTQSQKHLIGEPVKRPDGNIVRLYTYGDKGDLQVDVSCDGSYYTAEEMSCLGSGNFIRGVIRVGNAYYMDTTTPRWQRIFDDELKERE